MNNEHAKKIKHIMNVMNNNKQGKLDPQLIIDDLILFIVNTRKRSDGNSIPPLVTDIFFLDMKEYGDYIKEIYRSIENFCLLNEMNKNYVIGNMIYWDYCILSSLEIDLFFSYNDLREALLLSQYHNLLNHKTNIIYSTDNMSIFIKNNIGIDFDSFKNKTKKQIKKCYRDLNLKQGKYLLVINEKQTKTSYQDISKNSINEASKILNEDFNNINLPLNGCNIDKENITNDIEDLKYFNDEKLSNKNSLTQIENDNHYLSFLTHDTLLITDDNKLIFQNYTKGVYSGYLSKAISSIDREKAIHQLKENISVFKRVKNDKQLEYSNALLSFISQSKTDKKYLPLKAVAVNMNIPLKDILNYAKEFLGVNKSSFLKQSNPLLLAENSLRFKNNSEDRVKLISSIEQYKKNKKNAP